MPKKIKITDIASASGVSNATVSRVLNYQGIVNEATRQKVLDAAKELGLEINSGNAWEIKKKELNKVILLILPNIANQFYNEIVIGAQNAARRHGFSLLISTAQLDNKNVQEIISLIKHNGICGVITVTYLSEAILAKLTNVAPVVQCCEYCEQANVSYVAIDDYSATKSALNYMYSLGRRKFGFINGPSEFMYSRHRRNAFIDFMNENNMDINQNWIIQLPEVDFDMALASVTQVLSKADRPDAIFAVSDIYASATIKGAKKSNILIPDELMVIGFDNINISFISDPTITTINQPKFQLGYTACELLCEKILSPNLGDRYIILDTELIIRESTMH